MAVRLPASPARLHPSVSCTLPAGSCFARYTSEARNDGCGRVYTEQIINIKASMNIGLSNFLKAEFNEITPVERPIINTENIPDPNWIAGFVTGEGNFDVRITQQSTNKIGSRVQLRFRISQRRVRQRFLATPFHTLAGLRIASQGRQVHGPSFASRS